MGGVTAGLGGPNPNSTLSQLSNINQNLYGTYAAGLEPSQQLYPYATQVAVPASISTPLQASQIYGEALNNPYYTQAVQGAQGTQALGQDVALGGYQTAKDLYGVPLGQTGQATRVSAYEDPTAAAAAQAAGTYPQFAGLAQQVAGLSPQITGLAPQVTAPMAGLQQAGQQLYNTSLDPQQALYNRLRQQSLDQSGALASMTGTASSPYAAGVAGQNLNDLNINWQNQQLARQAQGLQGMSAADTAAAGLGTAGGNLYGLGSNVLGQAGNLYGQGVNALGAAGNLYGQAGSLGGLTSSILGAAPGSAQSILNLGLGGAGGYGQAGAAPYSTVLGRDQSLMPLLTSQQNLNNQALQGLTSASNLGQTQYDLPISAAGGLDTLLKTQQLINQQAGGNIGGLLGGAGSFLGGLTGSGQSGLGGLGGFFGNALGGLFGGGPIASAADAAALGFPGAAGAPISALTSAIMTAAL